MEEKNPLPELQEVKEAPKPPLKLLRFKELYGIIKHLHKNTNHELDKTIMCVYLEKNIDGKPAIMPIQDFRYERDPKTGKYFLIFNPCFQLTILKNKK